MGDGRRVIAYPGPVGQAARAPPPAAEMKPLRRRLRDESLHRTNSLLRPGLKLRRRGAPAERDWLGNLELVVEKADPPREHRHHLRAAQAGQPERPLGRRKG